MTKQTNESSGIAFGSGDGGSSGGGGGGGGSGYFYTVPGAAYSDWTYRYIDELRAQITHLNTKNEQLRRALIMCRTELFNAANYRGYEGGPLEKASVGLALREADAALKESSDGT